MKIYYIIFFLISIQLLEINALLDDACPHVNTRNNQDENTLLKLSRVMVPNLNGKRKGEAGKVAVIGGSVEYTGAPYFAAISALKVGADLVTVITTENAAPIIKSYSPDLIVIPHTAINISSVLAGMHVAVLGPGLGRSSEALNLAYTVVKMCRELKKPLVIDADGLFAIYKNAHILKNYPSPGAILTPNGAEVKRLKQSVMESNVPWYSYWGNNVTVLQKGEMDTYFSSNGTFDWILQYGGSGRRAGGQGDILAGALGTFLNWGLKANLCDSNQSTQLAQSVAAYAAARLTRACNSLSFQKFGRSMIASDMLNEIHSAFDELFL